MNEIETTEALGSVAVTIMKETHQLTSALNTGLCQTILTAAIIVSVAIFLHAVVHGLLVRKQG